MSKKKIKGLSANPRNPRRITDMKLSGLSRSLEEFGDLSGIVFNRRTERLVGGHQRVRTLPDTAEVHVERKYEAPTRTGTVAEGYVIHNGERYGYREVDWDERKEAEAMLAANKHGGTWDRDLLKLLAVDVPGMDFSLAGFEIPEVQSLGIHVEPPSIPVFSQSEPEETDEEYVRNTPQTTEQIPTENPSLNKDEDPFENIDEPQEIQGRRIVIIIDCPNEDVKKDLKERLRPTIEQAGAKIF